MYAGEGPAPPPAYHEETPMDLQTLDTPSLILDKKKLAHNIMRMEDRMAAMGVLLRPHGKTAKCAEAMRLFRKTHTSGISVSTVKEAEYYFSHGFKDILYAVGFSPQKLDRICRLVKKGAHITLTADSLTQADAAANAAEQHQLVIPIMIEIDCDGQRAGITPDDPLLPNLGRFIEASSHLVLKGVMTHAGKAYQASNLDTIKEIANQEQEAVRESSRRLAEAGLPCPVTSIGSTPTAAAAREFQGISEVRAGVFMFQDLVTAGLDVCSKEDIALSVLTTIISVRKKMNMIIVDAGWTALSRDRGTALQKTDQGYGVVCDPCGKPISGLIVSSVNQEHGVITHRENKPILLDRFPVGRRLRILPNHACATAACHDRYYVLGDNDALESQWMRINGWI